MTFLINDGRNRIKDQRLLNVASTKLSAEPSPTFSTELTQGD